MSETRFKTLAIDSGSELARLAFAWDLKGTPMEWEKLRGMTNYMGAGERMNKIMRRLKTARDQYGMEVVVIFHEGLDKLYGRGGVMDKDPSKREPYDVKGRIDVPGTQTPEECMRTADNVLRVRPVNGEPRWIAKKEPIGGSTPETWEVKTRFNAAVINSGFLPASYIDLRAAMEKNRIDYYGPFIWMLYGGIGNQKTRSLLTFPRPIRILDVDKGTAVIMGDVNKDPENFHITQYDSENFRDYERFILDLEECFDPSPVNMEKVKTELAKRK